MSMRLRRKEEKPQETCVKEIFKSLQDFRLILTSSASYTRVIFIRNFFIRNQAEILQIYYRVTSLLLLKELRLAENPIPYKKNSSV